MSIFTTEEAAEYLRLKPKTLQRWRLEGKGPVFIEPERNVVRYREQDIIEWLAGSAPKKELVKMTKADELAQAMKKCTSFAEMLELAKAVGESVSAGEVSSEDASSILALAQAKS